MEVGSALGIPDGAPLLAAELWVVTVASVFVPYGIADTTAIGSRLIAESAVIAELLRAVLPADWAHSIETSSA